ncbi:unnamed protein product [Brassica oleracea]
METSPVRLLLRARCLVTPTLIWIESKPSLVEHVVREVMVMSSLESIANFHRIRAEPPLFF